MGSDSRFIDVIGYEALLDFSELEWQYEKLPIEDVQLTTTVINSLFLNSNNNNNYQNIHLPLFFEGDNNEEGLEDLTIAERERKEFEWNDNGDDLNTNILIEEELNIIDLLADLPNNQQQQQRNSYSNLETNNHPVPTELEEEEEE